MEYAELMEVFERVRDHAWQSYVSTIDESLPLKMVQKELIEHESEIYDLVYFYGRPKDTLLVIDELVHNYKERYPGKRVFRMKARDITTIMCEKIIHNIFGPILTEHELSRCDLFVLEFLDTVAGYLATEEHLYGILDWLLEHHVQIVITGNMRIADMKKLAPRICAQIDGGISCLVR